MRSGELGKVTFVRTWNYGNMPQEGIGNPPDDAPPAGLDWDMWLGPGAQAAVQRESLRRRSESVLHFRWFWDYAGGMMTDWGVHLLDIVQMAFNEVDADGRSPRSAASSVCKDNRETPDTLQVTYEYPNGFIATYENREANAQSMFKQGYGILFHGTEGHAVRRPRRLPAGSGERTRSLEAVEVKSSNNAQHGALGEFPRVREDAQAADQRYRDRPPLHHHRLLGNVAFAASCASIGTRSTRPRAARSAASAETRVPQTMEIRSVMTRRISACACLLSPVRSSAQPRKTVFLITDAEGVAGVCRQDQTDPKDHGDAPAPHRRNQRRGRRPLSMAAPTT